MKKFDKKFLKKLDKINERTCRYCSKGFKNKKAREKHEKMCCPLSFQSGIDYKPLSKEELEKQKWKWH